jgi:hypothetical protein
VTVAFLFEAKVQVLVKVAEGREMVWRNADLMQEGHCRGTGSVKLGIIKLLRMDSDCPSQRAS